MCGGFGSWDGDANFTRLKAALDVSIRCFQQAFIHIECHSCQCRCPDDASLRIDMCGGFCSLDRDANFTRLNAALDVSIWHFQRSLYTYRMPFLPVPVARRCILEDRHVWRLWQFGSRCEFHPNESSLRPISKGFSAKLLYI
jgi:hypothetical protein